jgi:hypothetical protein
LCAPPHLEHAVDLADRRHHGRRLDAGELDVDCDRAPVALLRDLERSHVPAATLDRLDHRARAPARGNLDEQAVDVGAVAVDDLVGGDPQRPEREQGADRCEERSAVVAGACRHPDRGDEPERRCGRQASNGEALADDRARAEEADAAHDLRGDPRRIGADQRAPAHEELAETVGRDERKERGA